MAGLIKFVQNFFESSENSSENITCPSMEIEKFDENKSEGNPDECESLQKPDNSSENTGGREVICKFYLVGKCRFGEKCKNIHDNSIAETQPPKSQQSENTKSDNNDNDKHIKNKKKPPMRTAADVINRIKWDPLLPEEFFIIGYLDRFLGVQEESFSTFSWEDLASVDYDVLAIPQHRIQYFKYKTEKVWDKTTRLDIVFGSTGETVNIMQFMENVDQEIKQKREQDLDDYDSDEDSDDDGPCFRTPMSVTMSHTVNTDNNVHLIAEEDRSTHFIAVKITNTDIVDNLVKVQNEIISHEEILQECCMKRGLFHMTIAMIRLEGQEGVDNAVQMMKNLHEQLADIVSDKSKSVLTIRGLNNFGQRVVYSEVQPVDGSVMSNVVSLVKNSVNNAGKLH